MADDQEMEVDSRLGSRRDHAQIESQLSEEYPNRPRNTKPTLPFHTLFKDLFIPLIDNRTRTAKRPLFNGRKAGPDAYSSVSPSERRRAIIERYISRWRRDVGDDFYPAFRLVIPDKDRDRGIYGLKEKILAKYLVKIMKIDKHSEDAINLLNWKLPGQSSATSSAGDFAGRCRDVISKRPMRTEVGDMTIDQVNELLDRLSAATKEEEQLPILAEFYKRMNADELTWLIRIILRQMKVGATEKTFLHIWHPDAETLFNISSNLRRVCWELYKPEVRLEGGDAGVELMQCFQPQLAQKSEQSLKQVVQKLRPTEDDPEFWIEEKLDGERIQLHMISDPGIAGGKRFKFWSRKAKDYTYLYGEGFGDETGALTPHIKHAFRDDVDNIILDGEMITWDPKENAIVPFGSLKTAALAESRNPFADGQRPVYRVFDILLVNDRDLMRYTLRDRRQALERSVTSVHQRLELHEYQVGTTVEDVETRLRDVVAQASEGLMLKSPRSAYRLDDRNGDWQKVKPEYMTGLGEAFDCLIIGGFYGSGRRGGQLSSFLCGLRAPSRSKGQGHSQDTATPTPTPTGSGERAQKFVSFFKVGGGMTANDYATIRHETDGKWIDWDAKRPPKDYVDLGASINYQREKPDVWIKPPDSLVVEVKAAQVTASEDYGCGLTLRFPRFKRLRRDKDWRTALSLDEFSDLKHDIEQEQLQKAMEIETNRRKPQCRTDARKKVLTVAGFNAKDVNKASLPDGPRGQVFDGLTLYVMTESGLAGPHKKTKLELEALVKANGAKVVQTPDAVDDTLCFAARRTVKVASLEKRGHKEIIKPMWIFDCIEQGQKDFANGYPEVPVPLEPERHLYFAPAPKLAAYKDNVDEYGDSFARDTTVDELRDCMDAMTGVHDQTGSDVDRLIRELIPDYMDTRGSLFRGLVFFFDEAEKSAPGESDDSAPDTEPVDPGRGNGDTTPFRLLRNIAGFAGVNILPSSSLAAVPDRDKATMTHIIAQKASDLPSLRRAVSRWRTKKIPHIVSSDWIGQCWHESTRVDEEAYTAR